MEQLFPISHSYLIPLLPLVGAIIAGFGCTGPRKKLAHWPIWIGVACSAILSISLLISMLGLSHKSEEPLMYVKNWFNWIDAGNFHVNAGYLFDPLTAVMLCVVCGIGFFITVFAAGYMKGEDGYFRFFAYLGLFIFMMTNLVMGENLVMLYLGWEGVGLCSYLLIGYYYDRPAAREAAKKAFLVNRVGDFGFALGIMLIFFTFGTISYFGSETVPGFLQFITMPIEQLQKFPGVRADWVSTCVQWAPFLLMLGAFGKSAQFPLYVWLPDAMEGPTPVSALIHAATMVTAGVYMIAQCAALFAPNHAATMTIAVIGAFTAIFAASIALRQFDLKKVFAYSTVSQLGFMFVGVGVLAPVAGVFHLMTHAFFKALLFLSSGVVMHAMMGELDMRKMSGLKTVLPKTRWLMLIGCCALSGIPFFSGFFSKDEIVAAAWEHSILLAIVLLITAFMTAYYTFRLYFRVFEGPTVVPPPPAKAEHHGHDDADTHHGGHEHEHHNHEPALMILPLVVLAVGAIIAGWFGSPLEEFLKHSPSIASLIEPVSPDKDVAEAQHMLHLNLMILSGAIALAGVGLAYWLHLKNRSAADRIAAKYPNWVNLLDHKYWVDEIYQNGIVEPLRTLGRIFFAIDRWIVDGIVNITGFVPQFSGFLLKLTFQRGYLQGYAAAMVFGIVVILLLMFFMNICLLLLVVIPLAGAIVGAFIPAPAAKRWALAVSLLTTLAGIGLASSFNFKKDLGGGSVEEQLKSSVQIEFPAADSTDKDAFGIQELGLNFHLGVDAISLWLVLLTVLLMPPALLASFESIKDRQKEYYAWMLVLLAAMLGVFISRDLLLFYIFFELTLIPMFFIIGIWGGPERRYAAGKFFLFTFGASVFTLAAVIYLGLGAASFDLIDVMRYAQDPRHVSAAVRFWLLIGLVAGFAVKVPLFPVHTWLPLAHTEAPTAGSVILAGVLLKLGTYGLMRLVLPLGLVTAQGITYPNFIHLLAVFCIIGILYGSLIAWVQQDIKKLVAYSSVAHLGFCVLGMIALNDPGMEGSVLYMINHGLSTGAMFLVIGMIYDRFHTRDINELSGLAKIMPKLAFFFVFFMLASIGLPGLNGFVSEFLTVLGAFTSEWLGIRWGVLAAIGVILGALYMLHMTARVIFGPLKVPGGDGHDHGHGDSHASQDIGGREIALLIPIAIAILLLGVLPNSILKTIADPIRLIRTPIVAPQSAQEQKPAADPWVWDVESDRAAQQS